MGMAASQARLLCITARIHDVEYQAQSIQNAKIQLATQSDQAYKEYLEALDATTLTIKTSQNGEVNKIAANFNNLCSKNKVNAATSDTFYAIFNNRNQLIVEDDVYEAYKSYNQKGDAYGFAFYMIGDEKIQNSMGNQDGNKSLAQDAQKVAERNVAKNLYANDKLPANLKNYYEALLELVGTEDILDTSKIQNDTKAMEDYEELYTIFQNELYKYYSADIYEDLNNSSRNGDSNDVYDKEDFDYDLFNHYVSVYNQIEANGGHCISIKEYSADADSNSDWLKNMIECGEFTIHLINTDKRTGEVSFNATSPSSDSCLGYTETTEIDKTALKKAEAKYEKQLKDIDTKDKRHDLTLSKLEAERTALTTEYDSVKKVIEDNIERTFGIFS